MDELKLNRFAVLGNPVSHSQSPRIHQTFAEQFGVTLSYEKLSCEINDFNDFVREFFAGGGRGLNITSPFKSDAAKLADRCSSMARLSESVNTLYRDSETGELVGETTDGLGWLKDIQRLAIKLSGANILVIGAGGAARVIVNQLLCESVGLVHVCNRTESRAEELVARGVSASGLENIPEKNWDLIINTLSVGWQGDYPDLQIKLGAQTSAYDLNYGQGAQPFIKWFEASGGDSLFCHDGWGMLVEQAAVSFSIWWGKTPATATLIERGPS